MPEQQKQSWPHTLWWWISTAGTVHWVFATGLWAIVTPILSIAGLFGGMPSPERWIALVGVFLLGVAIVVTALRTLAEWRAGRLSLAFFHPAPDNKMAECEADVTRLQQQVEELEQDKAKTAEVLGQLKTERDYVAGQAEHWHALRVYGTELSVFRPLNEADHRIMTSGLHELKPGLRTTLTGAAEVWAYLSELAKKHRGIDLWRDCVDRTERSHAEVALRTLEGTLEHGGDPRPFLVLAYTRYREWRIRIALLADLLSHPVSGSPSFISWMNAERRMLEELQRKLEIPQLRQVKGVIQAYDEAHGAIPELR